MPGRIGSQRLSTRGERAKFPAENGCNARQFGDLVAADAAPAGYSTEASTLSTAAPPIRPARREHRMGIS